MKQIILAAFLAVFAIVAPAHAQTYAGIFSDKGDRIEAKLAKISFPKKIGALTLAEAAEFSRKGETLDSGAQYDGPNRMRATLYFYRPGYADAALAAYKTDGIMPLVYGVAIKRTSMSVVALAGRPGSAIRITYSGASRDGNAYSTASAFGKIGGWVFKLRVSAPGGDRQAEVEAALDAILAAGQLDKDATVAAVAPLDFAAPCPPAPSGEAKVLNTDKSGSNALMAAILATPVDSSKKDKKDDKALPLPFPANGAMKVCSRGLLPGSNLEVIQPAGDAKPRLILVVVNDAGDVAAVTRNLLGDGYTLTRSGMGVLKVLGEIDRMPDNAELLRLFSGSVPGVLDTRVAVEQKANGDTTINVSTSTLK